MASALSHQRQYAFSLALYSVEGPEKDDHVLLQVGNWSSAAAVLTERRIDAITSEEELSTEINETGTKDRALWAGFRPLSSGVLRSSKADPIGKEDDITQVAFEEIKEIKIKRSLSVNSLSSLPELPIWPLTETMSKVVVRFNVQHSDRLTFYELVNRDAKTKLCNAVPIMVDDVFFFHPYRDDALTTSRDRRSGWGQTIKTYIAQQQKQETESVTATVSQPIGLPHLLDINHTFEQDDADKVLAFIIV
ncbi:hypothetical protein TW65_04877 [Stemphylium lycopersici]|uniref:Uncharacterized protein n=1 Tax=Stemphylium lycopersici TaxID=183478 RepID=A0A364N2X0_STELY|nr:hypothetical protein TW65_04877 [Stemphylium lycopersici]RAR10296.1 hypothetical protein DDE83_005067 [Stemphylium lycopersici]